MSALEQTYAALGTSSETPFDLVSAVIHDLGEYGIADNVLAATEEDVPWRKIAEVLAMMIWSTSDRGSQILRSAERWLNAAEDERAVFVALHLDAFPFSKRSDMEKALEKVQAIFPQLTDRCTDLIDARRREEA